MWHNKIRDKDFYHLRPPRPPRLDRWRGMTWSEVDIARRRASPRACRTRRDDVDPHGVCYRGRSRRRPAPSSTAIAPSLRSTAWWWPRDEKTSPPFPVVRYATWALVEVGARTGRFIPLSTINWEGQVPKCFGVGHHYGDDEKMIWWSLDRIVDDWPWSFCVKIATPIHVWWILLILYQYVLRGSIENNEVWGLYSMWNYKIK